ncbi:glutamyl-tRNA reductase [bacterium SCSIO 12696]|nr:glutamyl-tRNA reductase [bacterium SCSIO 12696]
MKFLALGINHRTASLDVRERVAFAPERMVAALQQARDVADLDEVVIISTCNRTEVYSSGQGEASRLLNWFADYHSLTQQQLTSCHYLFSGSDMARHMMRVACGLDSMVLGEPQILGQVKSAFAVAQEAGTVGGSLNQAFQQVFSVAKKVRTETAIGENPVSVAYAAVNLGQQIFSDLSREHALLIGAGETIELVARHLLEKGVGGITVANRTLERAQGLAQQFGAEAILLSDIPDHLHRADIVISSTASQLPILGKGAVESALKKRKHRPMFMVDIAVPRDIEPQVGQLSDVYLYTVDDLREVIDENIRSRESAALKAEKIIEQGVEQWQRQLRGLDAVEAIRALRSSTEQLRDDELEKAIKGLQRGDDPEVLLQQLARNLTNKFLHRPTTGLKQAGEEGRQEHIQLAGKLFALDSHSFKNNKT